jgi:hypothetical protein
MSSKRISTCAAVLVLLMTVTPALFGQAFTSLNGIVTDPSGGVIPGATIMVTNAQTGVARETISNSEGRYTFLQLLPGTYDISAKSPGFTDVAVKAVPLQVNSPATINLKFEKIGAVAETVQVEAAAVQVNTTDATLGNAVSTQAILELPFFARNVVGLLQLQPGVTENGQVNGGKSDQANVTLDGVDVNDQVSRSAFTSVLRVTLDSVQEFRTTTTNSNADQGRGSGAEVSLVTKTGTNEFHGSLYEYNRNTKFAANDFFSNRSGVPRAALNINVFGASIGGPIKKNKFFFFANYEGRRDASAVQVNRTVPTNDLKNGIVTYRDLTKTVRKIGPADIKTYADPAHIGANANSLKVFALYPSGNMPGSGDGYNTIMYRFNAPRHAKQDTYIARMDYTVDQASKHQLFLRGNLQNDHTGGTPQFPGQPDAGVQLANNKGLAAGYTWVLRPNMVNSIRYGFTRRGGETAGLLNSPYTSFRGYSTIYNTGTATIRFVPVHSISEDLAWTIRNHDIRLGVTFRTIANRSSNNSTFHDAVTNASGLLGSGAELYRDIPGGLYTGDQVTYTYAMDALLGLISQIDANYNYKANADGSATVIPVGGYVDRDFRNNEYEVYAQDSWRLRRNFTITYGLRASIMPPVHEANGQQVSPSIPLSQWLGMRGQLAAQGQPQSKAGDISFVLSSSPQGRPMYPQLNNFAPRLGLAWSPSGDSGFGKFLFGGAGKTSIRAGFGMYYDLIGQPLAGTYNAAAFGLSSTLSNPLNTLGAFTAPRFTDFYSIPTDKLPAAPKAGFPTRYPDLFSITGSIDDQLKAPYTMNMNFSWGREFSKGLFIQASYVGRLSRHSLVQRDLVMPTNMKDPKSGMTYFQAMQIMATAVDLSDADRNNAFKRVAPIAFFENLWPNAAAGGFSATQNIANYYIRSSNKGDFTNVLAGMDEYCGSKTEIDSGGNVWDLPCSSVLGPNAMFNSQFGAVSGWSSIGFGNYHAAQLTVRKRFTESLLFDFNYTLGKSIDLSSSAESNGRWGGDFITNSWSPNQRKGVSSYDTLHAVNAYGVWRLPFGRGMRFGSQMHAVLDAIVGGWQISGTYRQSSALPTTTSTGSVWPTNWQLSNPAVPNGNKEPAVNVSKNGGLTTGAIYPSLFATAADAKASMAAYRQSFPGEYGLKNNIRTNGNFNIDTMLAKNFKMPYKEGHMVQIRWESFNITNSAILNASNADMSMTSGSTWGRITSTRGSPRQMQFAVRYVF